MYLLFAHKGKLIETEIQLIFLEAFAAALLILKPADELTKAHVAESWDDDDDKRQKFRGCEHVLDPHRPSHADAVHCGQDAWKQFHLWEKYFWSFDVWFWN